MSYNGRIVCLCVFITFTPISVQLGKYLNSTRLDSVEWQLFDSGRMTFNDWLRSICCSIHLQPCICVVCVLYLLYTFYFVPHTHTHINIGMIHSKILAHFWTFQSWKCHVMWRWWWIIKLLFFFLSHSLFSKYGSMQTSDKYYNYRCDWFAFCPN